MANRAPFVNKSILVTAMIGLLVGCGGGSGSSSAPPTGNLTMQVTDGPGSDFDHVWVTITEIDFHTDADATKSDASWQKKPLVKPLTIDLAQLNNGVLSDVLSTVQLPVGTYKQIRLFLVGSEDPLTPSSQAITDAETPAQSLQWNNQVEYTDALGNILEAPLEIAYPTQGIQLNGTFTITANSTLRIAVDFDLEHDVVPFKRGLLTGFTLKPNLHYYDLDQAGAITGQVDTSKLCAVDGRGIPTSVTNCAFNLIVKAELLSLDGKRHYDARATNVNPQTGKFTLYPLLVKDLNGNPLHYDVMIRGRQMETMLITDVTPVLGTTPTVNPTVIQTNALPLTVNTNEYQAQFSTALSPLTGGYAIFQQTLSSDGIPYEIRWANTDPFTGKLWSKLWLENAVVHVAPYNSAADLNFTPTTPIEGSNDAYTVGVNEIAYHDLVNSPTAVTSSGSSFNPPTPTLSSGIQDGTINFELTLAIGNSGIYTYDKGIIVLSRFANIITTKDISADLTGASSAFSLTGIPAGSTALPVRGAYYYSYLMVWDSRFPFKSRKVVPITQMIDLRTTNATTVTATVGG